MMRRREVTSRLLDPVFTNSTFLEIPIRFLGLKTFLDLSSLYKFGAFSISPPRLSTVLPSRFCFELFGVFIRFDEVDEINHDRSWCAQPVVDHPWGGTAHRQPVGQSLKLVRTGDVFRV